MTPKTDSVAVLREKLTAIQAEAKRAVSQTEYTSVGEKAIRLIPFLLDALHPASLGADAVTEEMVSAGWRVFWGSNMDGITAFREAVEAALAARTGKGE